MSELMIFRLMEMQVFISNTSRVDFNQKWNEEVGNRKGKHY